MRSRSLALVSPLVLALACPSGSKPDMEAQGTEAAAVAAPERRPERPRRPEPGERAPELALESLAGGRVTLPAMSKADRAAVLIFGSFS